MTLDYIFIKLESWEFISLILAIDDVALLVITVLYLSFLGIL